MMSESGWGIKSTNKKLGHYFSIMRKIRLSLRVTVHISQHFHHSVSDAGWIMRWKNSSCEMIHEHLSSPEEGKGKQRLMNLSLTPTIY